MPLILKAHFLDLHLFISYDNASTKFYDKRDEFEFVIVNFIFRWCCSSLHILWSLYIYIHISHLIRFARASRHITEFNTCNKLLTEKLLKQGYQYHKLCKIFSNFTTDAMI